MVIDYDKHCKLEFGSYAQVHEEHNNSMITRTTGALALRPTGNAQGAYYFMSLITTGRRLTRYRWTALPMPKEVIDRVHLLAQQQHNNRGILFLDREGETDPNDDFDQDIDGAPDDHTYQPETDTDDDFNSDDYDTSDSDNDAYPDNDDENPVIEINNDIPNISDLSPDSGLASNISLSDPDDPTLDPRSDSSGSDNRSDYDENYMSGDSDATESEYNVETVDENDDDDDEYNVETVDDNDNDNYVDYDNNAFENDNEENDDYDNNEFGNENEEESVILTPEEIAQRMDNKYGPRNHNHNLRSRRPRGYAHLHACVNETLLGTIFTQYSVKTGIKMFGKEGVNAVLKELKQVHSRRVILPVSGKKLTPKQKKDALQYLMFLKKKRCGTVKGRGCADGRKQRQWTEKEDASAPTVANKSVFMSCTIDAKEGRDVATVDVPGAFMHVDMDELVHMRFEGTMAELLVRIDPKMYREHLIMENGKKILYVELKKALYGTLRAALLFWQHLTEVLKKWGFIVNPYDRCVANKNINGSQCTILWHVDDLKISHVDPNVVTGIIEQLEKQFGKEAPLTVNRGKIHDYLGMKLDYSEPGKVKITMEDYIQSMLNELPEDMIGTSKNPAAGHLFKVNLEAPKLSETKADFFHHYTAKLLFMCKRARPDIQTAVAFLTTRVKSPDEDDY